MSGLSNHKQVEKRTLPKAVGLSSTRPVIAPFTSSAAERPISHQRRVVEGGTRDIVVRPRHLIPLHIELPTRSTPHAGAVGFIISCERAVHFLVPASEEMR